MDNSVNLTEGKISKQLINYFLPIAAGTLFQQLYNAVDAIIVSKFVGKIALAAVGGSAAMIISLLINFFVALSGGATVIIAQFFGAKENQRLKKATGTAIMFCLIAGLFLSILCIIFAEPMLKFMKCPEETMVDSVTYMKIYFGGVVLTLLFNMESSILRAVGNSKEPFRFLFICCFINIILDLIFILIFKMGVAGAAYATVIAQGISVILTTITLRKPNTDYRLEWKNLNLDLSILRRMMHLGIPAGLQSLMYGISNLIIQIAINTLSTDVVSAWALTSKIDGFYWAIASACGTSIMNFAGQNYGAGKIDRVKATNTTGLKLFMVITLVMSGLLLTIGKFALPLFSDDANVISLTWEVMLYFVPFYFIWTFIEVNSGVLRGVGDAIVPVIICGIGICLYRIVWVYTVFNWVHTLPILCLCYTSSWLFTAIAFIIRYKTGHWLKEYKS